MFSTSACTSVFVFWHPFFFTGVLSPVFAGQLNEVYLFLPWVAGSTVEQVPRVLSSGVNNFDGEGRSRDNRAIIGGLYAAGTHELWLCSIKLDHFLLRRSCHLEELRLENGGRWLTRADVPQTPHKVLMITRFSWSSRFYTPPQVRGEFELLPDFQRLFFYLIFIPALGLSILDLWEIIVISFVLTFSFN